MDPFIALADIPVKDILPGFHGRMIHTGSVTVAHFRIDAGSVLPEHFHVHEQITNVLEGELELTINGEKRICKAGDCAVIPSNVPHSGRALTEVWVIDVFSPTREDYK
ncbi:MAG: cupin domain-containing protein [Saprospiraceae bacterium]